ncbi:hypothetical protein CACET_c29300 [Clostridium aceticum]|uniref:Uncharacterized protein n=1 Tax=Clostridium aceticum TaxID=84022 RepID=A0A0G3WG10_9CLOT|nr:hypothetical protein [Clostridium aceticum]AKL96374.1 hypothetical protein CACET_c29300 [Clostridium aceticum]
MGECKCQNPELKPEKEKCSEKQIKQCHGEEEKEHPCDCEKK